MSEYKDFSEQMYNDPEVHELFARNAIHELQSAVCAFDEPLKWQSSDGMSILFAVPQEFIEGSDEPVPYGKLRDMTMMDLAQSMQIWSMRRTTLQPNDGTILQENIVIHPGRIIVTTAVGTLDVLEEGSQGDFTRNSLADTLNDVATNARPASVRDYANIDNALYDLKPLVEQRWDSYHMYLANMTPEDMRNHRAMKRDWLVSPEEEKTDKPKFWGITVGDSVWLVKAASAEEAVLDLEDHFELGREPLFMFITDPYDDVIQAELDDKYPEGGIRRLIPWSIVEWPENSSELTDEQQVAFDKFK